jgi:hypothetical protein
MVLYGLSHNLDQTAAPVLRSQIPAQLPMAHRRRAFGIGPPRPRFPWLASDRMLEWAPPVLSEIRCPHCLAFIPSDAAEGLCPPCLFTRGLEVAGGRARPLDADDPPRVDDPFMADLRARGGNWTTLLALARGEDPEALASQPETAPDESLFDRIGETSQRGAKPSGFLKHLAEDVALDDDAGRQLNRGFAIGLLQNVLKHVREDWAAAGRLEEFERLKHGLPAPCVTTDRLTRAADADPNTGQPFPSPADILVSRFRVRLYEEVLFNVSGPQDVPDEMRRLREFSATAPVPPRPWVESPRTRAHRRRTWR